MVCLKIMKADPIIKQYLKHMVFPNAYQAADNSSSRHNNKDKNMAAMDCPEGSIRYLLISYMISLDTNIKRCVNEVLFLLCNQDGTYVYVSFTNTLHS